GHAPNSLFQRFIAAQPAVQEPVQPRSGVDIIIPYYRNPVYASLTSNMLRWCAGEVNALDGRVVLINDSPDDSELASILAAMIADLTGTIDLQLIENKKNLGFVKSTNFGLRQAAAA